MNTHDKLTQTLGSGPRADVVAALLRHESMSIDEISSHSKHMMPVLRHALADLRLFRMVSLRGGRYRLRSPAMWRDLLRVPQDDPAVLPAVRPKVVRRKT